MHTFQTPISHIALPKQFTYPFHYTPHPLCVLAAEEVQAYLHTRPEWHDELQHGKMFGVLIVQDAKGSLGYLAAFSGNLAGSNHHPFFVPPVFDLLDPNGYFKQEEARISALNHTIQQCHPTDTPLLRGGRGCVKEHPEYTTPYCYPDDRREEGSQEHTAGDVPAEGQNHPHGDNTHVDAHEILRFALDDKKEALDGKNYNIVSLKEQRKQRSIALQQWIFRQFRLLNARGEAKDIEQIFEETTRRNPPAGTGECAAPKLLQYAYLHGLQPLAMAEFWWGDSPKGEIRRHGHYYPSCRHKCEPILHHMLQGLDVEPNPLLVSNTDATQLHTVYEDEYLLVVNKPAGMLSVPGKTGQASVLSILQERYPDATGPLLVHRLDMDTSGLLLAAKDKDIHAQLQAQFESRSVKKRYVALLEGIPHNKEPKGFIRLPLRPDYDNRPYQLVDFEYGKPAVTRYEIISPALCHPEPSPFCHPERSEGSREHPQESPLLRGGRGCVTEPSPLCHPDDRREEGSREHPAVKNQEYAPEILRREAPLNDKKARDNNTHKERTRILYHPETGRTHQLRVHSAHPDGMGCPIVGDPLYGQPADRLYLHAETLEFRHPVSGKMMKIKAEPPF